jgi:hypothetical protein
MKRVMLGALGLMLAMGTASAQRLTDQERRETETKLEQLRQEMRELERKLGREATIFRMPDLQSAPWAYSIALGRPRLGVTVNTDASPATDSVGAEIQAVTPDGPAAQAGIQAGDIVIRFNNEALARRGENAASPGDRLIELARELDEGDTVRVQYRRGGDKNRDRSPHWTTRPPPTRCTCRQLNPLPGWPADRVSCVRRRQLQVESGLGMWVQRRRWSDLGSPRSTPAWVPTSAYRRPPGGSGPQGFVPEPGGDVILRIGGRVPTSPVPECHLRSTTGRDPGGSHEKQARTEVKGTVRRRGRS